jgi:hypothetical protein
MLRAEMNAKADELSSNAEAFGNGMVSCFFLVKEMIEDTVIRVPLGDKTPDQGDTQSSAKYVNVCSLQSLAGWLFAGGTGFMGYLPGIVTGAF